MRLDRKNENGFSLVEILLVLIIVGLIVIMLSPLVSVIRTTVVEGIKYKEDRRQIERFRELLKAEINQLKILNQIITDIDIAGYISRKYNPISCNNCVTGDDTGIRARGVNLKYNLALVRGNNGNIILSISNSFQDERCAFTVKTNETTPFLQITYNRNLVIITYNNNTQFYTVNPEAPRYLNLRLLENVAEISHVENNNVTTLFTAARPANDFQFEFIASNNVTCHLSIRGEKFRVVNLLISPSTIVEPYVIRDGREDIRITNFITTFEDDAVSSELMILSPKPYVSPRVVRNIEITGTTQNPVAIIHMNPENAVGLSPDDLVMLSSIYVRQGFIAVVTNVFSDRIEARILTKENTTIRIYSDAEDFSSVQEAFYGAILIQMNYPVYYYYNFGKIFRREVKGPLLTETDLVATNIADLNFQKSYNLLRVYILTSNRRSLEETMSVPGFSNYVRPDTQ